MIVDTPTNAKMDDRPWFNGFIGIAILTSVVLMGVETDHDLGTASYILSIIFAVIWLFEFVVRVRCNTFREYIKQPSNRVDFCLVLASITEAFLLPLGTLISGQSLSASSMQMMSFLRLVRLLRVVRVVRVLTFFRELWLMVRGMVLAIPALGWVALLIMIELYVAALLITSVVGHDCQEAYVEWGDCEAYFGNIPFSMLTLFQVVTLDGWAENIARPIMKEKPWLWIFFLLFLYMTTFGTMNLLVGILVDFILRASAEDVQKLERAQELQEHNELELLRHIFYHADHHGDNDGMVCMSEFLEACDRPDVQEKFASLDLPVSRKRLAQRVWEVLDCDQAGKMTVDQVIERAWQLKKEGKHLQKDQTLLLMDVRFLARRLDILVNHYTGLKSLSPAKKLIDTPIDEPIASAISSDDYDNCMGTRDSTKESIGEIEPQPVPAAAISSMEERLGGLIAQGFASMEGRMRVLEGQVQKICSRVDLLPETVSGARCVKAPGVAGKVFNAAEDWGTDEGGWPPNGAGDGDWADWSGGGTGDLGDQGWEGGLGEAGDAAGGARHLPSAPTVPAGNAVGFGSCCHAQAERAIRIPRS